MHGCDSARSRSPRSHGAAGWPRALPRSLDPVPWYGPCGFPGDSPSSRVPGGTMPSARLALSAFVVPALLLGLASHALTPATSWAAAVDTLEFEPVHPDDDA